MVGVKWKLKSMSSNSLSVMGRWVGFPSKPQTPCTYLQRCPEQPARTPGQKVSANAPLREHLMLARSCHSLQLERFWLGSGLWLASSSMGLTVSGDPQHTSTHSTKSIKLPRGPSPDNCALCRAHTVRFFKSPLGLYLSDCTNMMIMSHYGISVVINVRLYDSQES